MLFVFETRAQLRMLSDGVKIFKTILKSRAHLQGCKKIGVCAKNCIKERFKKAFMHFMWW